MNFAKFFITGLAAVAALSVSVFAATASDQPTATPLYMSISGEIADVTQKTSEAKSTSMDQLVKVTYDTEGVANFVIESDSYGFTDAKPTKDASFTGFYDAQIPTTLIYPPTYKAVVYAVDLPTEQSIKVDKFDENMLSYDKDLKLNVGEATEVITPDGKKYEGALANKRIAVLYAITTRSMPPQTTPLKIVVLGDDAVAISSDPIKATEVPLTPIVAVPPLHALTDEEKEMLKRDYKSMKITVNGKELEGAEAALTTEGEGLLPLRAIAESMGLTVEWFGDTKTVQIGKNASLIAGKDAYSINRSAPQELGIAPQLIKDRTYVPFVFFDQILKAPVVIKDGKTIDITYSAIAND